MADQAQTKTAAAKSKARNRGPVPVRREVPGISASEAIEFFAKAPAVLKEDWFLEPKRTNVGTQVGDYVRFLDTSDSLLTAILTLVSSSPTLGAIIAQKVQLSIGDGFNAMKGRSNSLFSSSKKTRVAVTDEAVLQALDDTFAAVNADGDNLLDLCGKGYADFWTFGNCYFGMSRGKDKNAKPFFYGYLMPFVKGRPKLQKDKTGKTLDTYSEIGFSEEWQGGTGIFNGLGAEVVPVYPKWAKDTDGIERTVIHLKNYTPGFDLFGLPDYVAALLFAEWEYKIAKFNLDELDNGFNPSAIVQFFGASTPEEGKRVLTNLAKSFTGTGKNKRIFAQVLRDQEMKANVQTIDSKKDGNFLDSLTAAAQEIVTASRWSMSLAGIATSGKLGSNEQIRREFDIIYNTVIKPKQTYFQARFVEVFVKEAAAHLNRKEFADISLEFSTSIPISFISDISLDGALTQDEIREIAGYGPLPKSEQTPSTPNPNDPNAPNQANPTDNGNPSSNNPNPAGGNS